MPVAPRLLHLIVGQQPYVAAAHTIIALRLLPPGATTLLYNGLPIPAVCLATALGWPSPPQRHALLVHSARGDLLALLVTAARELHATTTHPLPSLLAARLARPWIAGVALLDGALAPLLDMERIVADLASTLSESHREDEVLWPS